jgi:succinoglycan biosynthesis protein ExoW
MNFRTAVVIPFYQRKAGILVGAVRAALAQQGTADFEIIVVDDCSPIPAATELKNVMEEFPYRIRIVKMKKNSGQGAGRNKGLDSVLPETEYVAFLDSDDQWAEDHLRNALFGLDQGFDFYFSDFYQLHQTVSAFRRAKRIDPAQHPLLPGSETLHVFQGNMFNQVIKGNILGMSTIVYRFRKFPELRFREEFRSTGEEYLFWLDLARLTKRIAFSSAIECHYGEGVNTYSGAAWGSEGAIRKLHDEMKYLCGIRDCYDLSQDQNDYIVARISKIRIEFVRELIHRVVHLKSIDGKLCLGVVRMDPGLVVSAIPISLRVTAEILKQKAQ